MAINHRNFVIIINMGLTLILTAEPDTVNPEIYAKIIFAFEIYAVSNFRS